VDKKDQTMGKIEPSHHISPPKHASYSEEELAKFAKLADQWWNPHGALKTLHDINPFRLSWIQQLTSLRGKKVLDIGCGGGILSESMALAGAEVTAIDLAKPLITVAKHHMHMQCTEVNIDYQCTHAETLLPTYSKTFDVITCMELLEHVPDPGTLLACCAQLLCPTGKLFVSTINRTMKSYLFAIIAAEYVLKLLPIGTHNYEQFIRPSELAEWANNAGLGIKTLCGLSYYPISKRYQLSRNIHVNYMACLQA